MAYLGRIWAHGVSGAFMAYVSGVISRFGHSPAGISLAKNSLASFGGGALRTIATRRVGVVTCCRGTDMSAGGVYPASAATRIVAKRPTAGRRRTDISERLKGEDAPVHANRIGHDANVLLTKGHSRTARAFRWLRNSLQAKLERYALLSLSFYRRNELRDVLFLEDGWGPRFGGFKGPRWSRAEVLERLGPELLEALHRLGAAILSSTRARGVHVPPSLVLAAVQVTAMRAHSVRGEHFDNPDHGDLVVSLTITGAGTVCLSASDTEPQGVTHERSGTWYALFGNGLRDYKHAVRTVAEPRLSVTYRYVLAP
jgi:hypothetical protein